MDKIQWWDMVIFSSEDFCNDWSQRLLTSSLYLGYEKLQNPAVRETQFIFILFLIRSVLFSFRCNLLPCVQSDWNQVFKVVQECHVHILCRIVPGHLEVRVNWPRMLRFFVYICSNQLLLLFWGLLSNSRLMPCFLESERFLKIEAQWTNWSLCSKHLCVPNKLCPRGKVLGACHLLLATFKFERSRQKLCTLTRNSWV